MSRSCSCAEGSAWPPGTGSGWRERDTGEARPRLAGRLAAEPPPAGRWGGRRAAYAYWASLALSLSSFPHSQSFPGSTAKCRGSSLCSESVRGITAGTERDAVPGGPRAAPREDSEGTPRPGVSVVRSSGSDLHRTPVRAGALRSRVAKPLPTPQRFHVYCGL